MNLRNNVANLFTLILCLSAFGLVGCGGGGGGGGSGSGVGTTGSGGGGNPAAVAQSSEAVAMSSKANASTASSMNFNADTRLLGIAANASGNLYVDPQFSFESTKQIELRMYASDGAGQPLAGKRLDIYAVPVSVESLQSEEAQTLALLVSGFTDAAGEFYRRVDVPVTVEKIKLQLDALGIESQALLTLDQSVIEHRF